MTDNEKLTAEQIAEQLSADGYTLEFSVVNPGGYNVASEFACTIKRGRAEFKTPYTKGCGHRRWKSKFVYGVADSIWAGIFKRGQRVTLSQSKYRIDSEPAREFNTLTEPEAPTLDEVLYSLSRDADCVRHGQTFEEFCADFGYDSDSIKAKGIFDACRETWSALVRFGADFEKLDSLFQDY